MTAGAAGASLGLLTNTASASSGTAPSGRLGQWTMRDTSADLLPGERVCNCGWRPVEAGEGVRITRKGDSYGVGGLRMCGSVWTCPVCAVKVAATRTAELGAATRAWRARGGVVYLVTLTIRHKHWEALSDNLAGMTRAMRRLWSGRAAVELRERFGVVGLVRNLEVTWGAANGWHPHSHAVFFMREDIGAEALRAALSERWIAALSAEGLDASDERGVDVKAPRLRVVGGREERVWDDAVGEYVVKMVGGEAVEEGWTAAHEVAWSHIKRTKGERYTPWMLLAAATVVASDADEGLVGNLAPALWQEFAVAFKGRRQLFWSRGLRELLATGPEVEDEAIAEAGDEDAVVVAHVEARVWYWLRVRRLVPAMLTYAEAHGEEGLACYLDGARHLVSTSGMPYGWMREETY